MGMSGNLVRVSPQELESFMEDSSLLLDLIFNEKVDDRLTDIDKAWDGICFLLSGERFFESSNPLVKALFSVQFIDQAQDLGYGPAHYLTADQVKDMNERMMKVTTEDLKKQYDGQKMMDLDIYPQIWLDEDALDYLLVNFEAMRETYATAAKNGEAMITYVS